MAEQLWTIQKVLQWTQQRFTERGLATARLDAEVLLAHVLGKDRVFLYTHSEQPLAPEELAAYRELIRRRLAGEPIAYLVGKREFRSLALSVDARVLVPRPDTETAVDVALAALAARPSGAPPPVVVDVGVGSGAIALAIKAARPEARVLATDLSPEAAAVARANAAALGLEVDVREGDLLAPVGREAPFDLVVSNPPYIPTGELPSLPPEVRREPRLALDGGADGLDLYRRLAREALPLVRPGGALVVEVGAGQADDVAAIFRQAGWEEPRSTADLAGIARVVSARRPGAAPATTATPTPSSTAVAGSPEGRAGLPPPDELRDSDPTLRRFLAEYGFAADAGAAALRDALATLPSTNVALAETLLGDFVSRACVNQNVGHINLGRWGILQMPRDFVAPRLESALLEVGARGDDWEVRRALELATLVDATLATRVARVVAGRDDSELREIASEWLVRDGGGAA
jgi:release factor glutamine methyltransferase